MDAHFDICLVFEISKFDIARLTCTYNTIFNHTNSQMGTMQDLIEFSFNISFENRQRKDLCWKF